MNSSRKVVVITGCSSGFGEGAVRAFADKGYRVWGTLRGAQGRNAAKKAALEAYSSRVSVFDMDVTDDASVAAAFAHILSQGPVDVLINNAGVMYLGITEAFSVHRRAAPRGHRARKAHREKCSAEGEKAGTLRDPG